MNRSLPLFSTDRIARPGGTLRPPLRLVEPKNGLHQAGQVASHLVSEDGILAAAFADSTLRAFATDDLSERWSIPLGGPASRQSGAPVFHEGRILTQMDGNWSLREVGSGETIREFSGPENALWRGLPHGDGFLTVWVDDAPRIGRIDTGNGELTWSRKLDGAPARALALGGDIVAAALLPSRIEGIDALTGDRRWSFEVASIGGRVDGFGASTGEIAGWPVVVDGHFLQPVRSSHWIAIDAKTGAERWRARLDTQNPGLATLVARDRLMVVADRLVAAIDPGDGTLQSSRPFSADGLGTFGAPAVSDSHLFAVDNRSGRIAAFHSKTGRLEWMGPTGGSTAPDNPPLILNGRLITVDLDGNVRIFEADTNG